jgi:beta-ketoacyl synthase-like protein
MTPVYLDGIGIEAPGLSTWNQSAPVLRGESPFNFEKRTLPIATLIPNNERRRASDTIHLAVNVAEEAIKHAKVNPQSLINIFSSFRGALKIVDHICNASTLPGHPISPTQFHNSVYNAPASYWSIATDTTGPSTSLACAESSFPAALLSAVAYVSTQKLGVLLVMYDVESPKPFHKQCAIEFNCGVALVLMPSRSGNSLAKLEINFQPLRTGETDNSLYPFVENLMRGNASAQPLSILSKVANQEFGSLSYDYLEKCAVDVNVQPCN